ncbi:MAG: sigma-70 factor domain-containing protein, partial [Nitrospirales bacterium]
MPDEPRLPKRQPEPDALDAEELEDYPEESDADREVAPEDHDHGIPEEDALPAALAESSKDDGEEPLQQTPPVSSSVVPVTALQQYLAEVRRYPYLSKEEELRLFREYHEHDNREAAVKLILANLRVSVAIASEYLHTGADFMDLIQECNVGLLQA